MCYLTWLSPRIPRRSVWVRFRSQDWWRCAESGRYNEEWWKANFRMSRDTYLLLCRELRPYIKRKTSVREPISVERRVAVTIYKLATNLEYRSLSNLFGIGLSTVCVIVVETCKIIADKLLPKYVYVPQGDCLEEIVTGFERLWGFPQAAGAIDGSHIPIKKPLESASDYYNRKGYYSVIVQALVDHRGRFLDICVGWPGKVHDARVFSNSALFSKGTNKQLFPGSSSRNIGGVQVPLVILGDPAYPLLPWVMKPYTENEHTPAAQKLFNYRESRARMVVENGFGRLKGRWRCLLKQMDFSLKNVSSVIVLHNVCEMYGDNIQDEWVDEAFSTASGPCPPASQANTATPSSTATRIRDAIKDYLVASQ